MQIFGDHRSVIIIKKVYRVSQPVRGWLLRRWTEAAENIVEEAMATGPQGDRRVAP